MLKSDSERAKLIIIIIIIIIFIIIIFIIIIIIIIIILIQGSSNAGYPSGLSISLSSEFKLPILYTRNESNLAQSG